MKQGYLLFVVLLGATILGMRSGIADGVLKSPTGFGLAIAKDSATATAGQVAQWRRRNTYCAYRWDVMPVTAPG